MRVKKYEGATMRDALAKVKAELGDQAVIISTRQVRRGLLGSAIEISAAVETDDAEPEPALSGPTGGGPVAPPSAPALSEQDLEKLIGPLRSELRSLRALVRTSGDSRATTEMRSELAALRRLVEEMHRPAPAADPAPAGRRAGAAHDGPRARTTQPGDTPLTAPTRGTAVMLIGPTGAGKTTTIAKIAARAALIDGRRVGLITLDNYRIGGIDQIRTFAELIGVPLEVAETPAALGELIDPAHELTLIDTAGRSPREEAIEIRREDRASDELRVHATTENAVRALSPLIENAVQHAVEQVTITVGDSPRAVGITISDDGPGLPSDGGDPELLFAAGARAADSTGAGLGLALARRVARTLGGDVTVTSERNPTSFTLTLPRP